MNLQNLFKKEMAKLPRVYAEKLITKKLAAAGVERAEDVAPLLFDHFVSGTTGDFIWDDGTATFHDISITITQEEVDEIGHEIDRFIREKLPSIVQNVLDDTSTHLLASLEKTWPEHNARDQLEFEQFRERLEANWGKAFSLVRMILTICREIGEEQYNKSQKSKRRHAPLWKLTLIRLHARACQITSEVLALMESGYADGAMARWRTLHEIHVVATLIAEHRNDLARRYLDHEAVDAKRGLEQFQRCHAQLGYAPPTAQEVRRLTKRFERVIKKYGKAFGSQYGWAAHHLNKNQPTFADLESAAGRSALRSHYKLASSNVHAGPTALFSRLGAIEPSTIAAGASNVGFAEPGQNTALTLCQITLLLLGEKWTYEQIVSINVLAALRERVPEAFLRAEKKIRREDSKIQKWLRDAGL